MAPAVLELGPALGDTGEFDPANVSMLADRRIEGNVFGGS
jgi:hypothetical protein